MLLCTLMLFGIIYSNTTVNALQVDMYSSVLDGDQLMRSANTYAHGFIGLKFREDFKQLVYNVDVNNIENITGIHVYSRSDNRRNATMLLDLLEEAKEVKVKEKFKEDSMMLAKKLKVKGTVAVGGVTSDDRQGELKGKSLGSSQIDTKRRDIHDCFDKGISAW
jgi:hypothetical protein